MHEDSQVSNLEPFGLAVAREDSAGNLRVRDFGGATGASELGSSTVGASAPVSVGAAEVGEHPASSTARTAAVRIGPTGLNGTNGLLRVGHGMMLRLESKRRGQCHEASQREPRVPLADPQMARNREAPSIARPTVLSS